MEIIEYPFLFYKNFVIISRIFVKGVHLQVERFCICENDNEKKDYMCSHGGSDDSVTCCVWKWKRQ